METYKVFLLLCLIFMGSCGKKPKRVTPEVPTINMHIRGARIVMVSDLVGDSDYDPQDYDLSDE